MSHEPNSQGSHDSLGLSDAQQFAESSALETDVNGGPGPLSPHAAEDSFDHRGRSLPQDTAEAPVATTAGEAYQATIPGVTVAYTGLARIKARRAQSAIDKARPGAK